MFPGLREVHTSSQNYESYRNQEAGIIERLLPMMLTIRLQRQPATLKAATEPASPVAQAWLSV